MGMCSREDPTCGRLNAGVDGGDQGNLQGNMEGMRMDVGRSSSCKCQIFHPTQVFRANENMQHDSIFSSSFASGFSELE